MIRMLRVALTVAVLAGGLSLVSSHPAPARAAVTPVVYEVDGGAGWADARREPHALYFGAGGNLYLHRMRWSHWGTLRAWTRRADINVCTPVCRTTRVRVLFHGVRVHKGQAYFARMRVTVLATGRRYKGYFIKYVPAASGPSWQLRFP